MPHYQQHFIIWQFLLLFFRNRNFIKITNLQFKRSNYAQILKKKVPKRKKITEQIFNVTIFKAKISPIFSIQIFNRMKYF